MPSSYRDHNPLVLDSFSGLWARGDVDTTPLDHFAECVNIKFVGDSSIETRDGIDISQVGQPPTPNIVRAYNYPTKDSNTLLVLSIKDDGTTGEIYHLVDEHITYGPILTLPDMMDFACIPYAGRAYISPFKSYLNDKGLNVEKGLEGEFLYVYAGDGTAARKAAGSQLASGNIDIAIGGPGHTDPGIHIFAVVSETISGYLTPPALNEKFTTEAVQSVSFGNIPTSGNPNVTKRHIVATKVIDPKVFNGDLNGYQFFFIPNATIPNNTTIFLNDVSFFDQDLIDDATHLLDNYEEIPAGAALSLFHDRLCLFAPFDLPSTALISEIGEPEAINKINGIIAMPPDGNPLTNGQELRDLLYVFKRSRTVAFIDNGEEPSLWPMVSIDNALGTCVHGIATVLDSGSSTVDYLIVATFQGISLFNGRYISPELSWKIETFWNALDRNQFRRIQIVNAPIQKELYIVLPDGRVLCCNYSDGMDPKSVCWVPWTYVVPMSTVAILNIDEIILGARLFELMLSPMDT